MLLALLFVRQSTAASLHPETLNAWDKDVQSAKAELSHDCHHLRPSTRRGSPPSESDAPRR